MADKKHVGKKKSRKAIRILLIVLLFFVILAGISAMAYVIPVEESSVSGNVYASENDITSFVFRTQDDYRLLNIFFRTVTGGYRSGAFKKLSLCFTGLQSVVIRVQEEDAFCAAEDDESYLILTEDLALIGRTFVCPDVTLLKGVSVRENGAFKTVTSEDGMLEKMVSILKKAPEYDLQLTGIGIENGSIYLEIGDARICMGDGSALEEKLKAAGRQKENLNGLKGVLHLEDYDGKDRNAKFYFTVEP